MTHMDKFKARLEEIQRLADVLDRHKTDLMEAAAYDAGFPIKITSIEVELSVGHLRTMDKEIPWVENGQSYGTVATIFPYDAPTVMLARLGGAALLTGNTLRFSLSSQTPRSASVLSEICKPFPSIESVVGMDNRKFGRRCVADKEVRLFFISGASAIGEVYRRQHQSFDKLFFAGPGGMPAAIVFEDADVTSAASFIARRAFINGGQYCTTLKKAYLHTSLYEEIRNQILDRVRRLNVGDALDPETDIGPIRVERTRNILQNALEKFRPARLLTGSINDETVFPLVLETENTDIPDLELFGPFLLLIPFDDADEAAMELIKTRYGFLLSFFGSPAEKIKAIFYSHFGMVHDNPDFTFTPLRLPFGGKKASGWILERKGNDWIERDGAFIYSKELA
ncbi:MAG: aldehyde dehydrogenase family protein, partial [Deltaproteobacteria bacterium]|nr:aldehyde dehydrogenase family protein [Deltaproteobacteria bacterium]